MNVFQIYRDDAGEWRFRLLAENGEIVAVSEGYETQASAEHGVDVVRRIAADAAVEIEGVIDAP